MSGQQRPPIIEKAGKVYIYDQLRHKYLLWTPEEEVRQQVLAHLIDDLHYPKGLIAVEAGLRYNKRMKRTDIVVYNNQGKPHMLVECKRPQTKIGKEAIFQLATYNNALDANILVLTNGDEMICLRANREENKLTALESIPPYK